ncbi:MAG: protein kinase, partial [Acidobacteria bacterium]|nr:protein kinase [Acidobacteriota bacterium]
MARLYARDDRQGRDPNHRLQTVTLSAGKKLGRYEIRSQLGAGGMGEVYLALDTELDRTVAIKILPEALASNQQRLQRFIQEAKAASALNHPHILTIHEIGTTETSRFIATEFIDGDTLRRRIRDGSLSLNEILDIAMQTAGALAAAHEAGIIHRDIKPENIMVRRDGYIKLLDFGLAKLTGPPGSITDTEAPTKAMVNTGAGTVMGSAYYMSPEQAKGTGVDARTDLWSLGAVLYEMVTGHVPFAGETPTEAISLILQREPAPLSRYVHEVPSELERIVSKTLTKNREERYQSARDLLIDLRNLKRKLEVDAEIDRTVPSDLRAAASTSAVQGSPATASGAVAATASAPASHGASSAEYFVSGIKQHKLVAASVVLAIVLGIIGFSVYLRTGSPEVAIESIAVLPFQNRSTEPDTEYLSDGLAESLIYRLSQLPNLKVSPTSSVFHYKGKEINPVKVGQELGVSAVLVGRMVQRGDNLTISAELVDVRYNKLLWGEQYERKMSELLATQREIAREIVDKLRLRVSVQEKGLAKHYTESNEAYQFYLKGRFYWNKRSKEGFQKALEYFQQAIESDPKFALAYSGLADTYNLLGGPEAGGDMPPNDVLPKAKAAALKALEIDDSLAEPHVSLGHVKYYYDRDWAAAEREFKRAIELNPNYSIAHHWYAIYLSVVGRKREALAEMRRAQELDPLSLPINVWLGRILSLSGESDQAIEQVRKTVEMDPNFIQAHYRLGILYEEKGMYDEANSEFEQVLKLSGGKPLGVAALARVYALAGKRAEAQKNLDELLQLSKHRYVSPTSIAMIYIALGDKDRAFAWLDEGEKAHDLNILRLKEDPI